MTLATRCAACGTSFRVVEDQLKVSEGWVRCGRCNEVFNAIESLFDTDAAPVQAPTPPISAPPFLPLPPRTPGTTTNFPAWPPPASTTEEARPSEPPPAYVAPSEVEHHDTADDGPARGPPSTTAEAPDTSAAEPAFVRQADRAALWNRPRLRQALLATAALLGLSLGAQISLLYRDVLAGRWPASRPALEAACAVVGCRIEPLRRIESLAVDASGLNQTDGSTVYRLSVVLRNRGDVELLLPALDLVLTNPQGGTVARRVLSTTELGSTARTLAAGSELALQASLNTGERRLSGYTIEIFYP